MLELAGYDIGERLVTTARTTAWRGRRQSDGAAVVVKLLNAEYPTLRQLASLQSEFSLARMVGPPAVPQMLMLTQVRHSLALVMHDSGGVTLSDWLRVNRPTPEQACRITLSAARALGELHARGVMHKDIKPMNLLLDAATGAVQVIDLGIAALLDHESQDAVAVHHLEGTLAYIAPEQTGRMNRSVDSRADLYALGAVLYEMLTGRPPFSAGGALELIAQHLARPPRPVHDAVPSVPRALSDVAARLLAKRPEDRYQSTSGLCADLELVLRGLQDPGLLVDFAAGRRDVPDRLRVPEALYGRDEQVQALTAAWLEVAQAADAPPSRPGGSRVVLVTGTAGVGKSALVGELQRLMAPPEFVVAQSPRSDLRQAVRANALATRGAGALVTGKFDQVQRSIPFGAILALVRDLVDLVLAEPEHMVEAWRERLAEAVGPNGALLADGVPRLAMALGAQPPVAELQPAEARNRLEVLLTRVLQAFARADRPLALFLDDLQWADHASLALLERFASDPALRHLLLVFAWRDDEIDAAHPLGAVLGTLATVGPPPLRIDLAPLAVEHVEAIVADALHLPLATVAPLAASLHRKTHGNPLFVGALLRDLWRNGALRFERATGAWQWDEDAVARTAATDNVVDWMTKRIHTLTLETRRVLQVASCLGHDVAFGDLVEATGLGVLEVARALTPAVHAGLLRPDGHGHAQLAQAVEGEGLVTAVAAAPETEARSLQLHFLHDRVQQAAYATFAEVDRQRCHLEIAERWLPRLTDPIVRGARLYDLAGHLAQGEPLVTDRQKRNDYAALEREAGQRARTATAYEVGLRCAEVGLRFLPPDAAATHPELAFELAMLQAECEYLTGRTAEAATRFQHLRQGTRSRDEQVAVALLQITLLANTGSVREAVAVGLEALGRLGIQAKLGTSQGSMVPDLVRARIAVRKRDSRRLLDLPEMVDPQKRQLAQLIAATAGPAFVANDQNLFTLLILKVVNLSLKHGNCRESGACFMSLGLLTSCVFGDAEFGYAIGKAGIELTERFRAVDQRPRALMVMGALVSHWWRPLRENLDLLGEGYRRGLEVGDLVYAGYCLNNALYTRLFHGDPLPEVAADAAVALRFCARTGDTDVGPNAALVLRFCAAVSGEPDDEGKALDPRALGADEDAYLAGVNALTMRFPFQLATLLKADQCLLYDDAAGALGWLRQSEALQPAVLGLFQSAEHQLLMAVALAGVAHARPAAEGQARRKAAKALGNHEAWLRKRAAACPANFGHMADLVAAERAGLRGDHAEATVLYERAVTGAGRSQFLWHAALSCLCASRASARRDLPDLARYHAREAVHRLQRWGAHAPARRLAETLGLHDLGAASGSSARGHTLTGSVSHTTTAGSESSAELDLVTVIQAAQAISGEIELERLLDRLLRIVAENVGARRVVLVLRRGTDLLVEAHGGLDGALDGASSVAAPGPADVAPGPHRHAPSGGHGSSGTQGVLQGIALSGSGLAPESIVQAVLRTQQALVLDDAVTHARFGADPYVTAHATLSVLCVPVVTERRLVGVLYAENDLASAAFPPARVQLLEILASQAAIAIENAHIVRAYGRFVPREFLRQIDRERIVDVRLGDQRSRTMSVLFSDIRGFTRLSERMSPEQTFAFVNAYLGHMGPLIREHGGFIDKYIGDAIMALFASPDGALRAAGAMLARLDQFNAERTAAGEPEIDIGIGINHGQVRLGTVGEAHRMDGTAIGDAVNLASRIEGLTKRFGVRVLVTAATVEALQDRASLALRPLGRVAVAGKDDAVEVLEVFDADAEPLRAAKRGSLTGFAGALACYQSGDFAAAMAGFATCAAAREDDGPARVLHDLAARALREANPIDPADPARPGWDGVSRFAGKD